MISLWTYRLHRKPVHSLDQNGRSFSRFRTETAQKPYLFWAAHTYMTYIREYPPECLQCNCVSFPGGDSNIKVAGGARRKIKITPQGVQCGCGPWSNWPLKEMHHFASFSSAKNVLVKFYFLNYIFIGWRSRCLSAHESHGKRQSVEKPGVYHRHPATRLTWDQGVFSFHSSFWKHFGG